MGDHLWRSCLSPNLAGIQGMNSLSKPRLPIKIYTFWEIISPDDFRKYSSPGFNLTLPLLQPLNLLQQFSLGYDPLFLKQIEQGFLGIDIAGENLFQQKSRVISDPANFGMRKLEIFSTRFVLFFSGHLYIP
jgi:hypothetical protein